MSEPIEYTIGNKTHKILMCGDQVLSITITTLEHNTIEECWYGANGKWLDLDEYPNKIVWEYGKQSKKHSLWLDEDGKVKRMEKVDLGENARSALILPEIDQTIKDLVTLYKNDILQSFTCGIADDVGIILPTTALRRHTDGCMLEVQCARLSGTNILVPTVNVVGGIKNEELLDDCKYFPPVSFFRDSESTILTAAGKVPLAADGTVDGKYVAILEWNGTEYVHPIRLFKLTRLISRIGNMVKIAIMPYLPQPAWRPKMPTIEPGIVISCPLGGKAIAVKKNEIPSQPLALMTGGVYVTETGFWSIYGE